MRVVVHPTHGRRSQGGFLWSVHHLQRLENHIYGLELTLLPVSSTETGINQLMYVLTCNHQRSGSKTSCWSTCPCTLQTSCFQRTVLQAERRLCPCTGTSPSEDHLEDEELCQSQELPISAVTQNACNRATQKNLNFDLAYAKYN